MAVGQVTENPPSNAVTRPTDPKTRDEDIERKLRLYGIGTAFSNGMNQWTTLLTSRKIPNKQAN
jgi:hypothetical protein